MLRSYWFGVANVGQQYRPDIEFIYHSLGCSSSLRMNIVKAILEIFGSVVLHHTKNWNPPSVNDFARSYDGGIGQGPDLESHGGSTFCAIASLSLMNELTNALNKTQLNRLRYWCLMRQVGGFHGRPNKPEDTCYSFWIGATLQILDSRHLTDDSENRAYILRTQDSILGGLAKFDTSAPDPLHTYLGLCGLSLLGEPGLQAVSPALNITQNAFNHLEAIHKIWVGD